MIYLKTTHVPNVIFDLCIPALSESELKVLLVVVRQTLGWKDIRTGARKERDRIASSQFVSKTGLSKRIVSIAIQKLCVRGLLVITDAKGVKLQQTHERKGRTYLFYSLASPEHLEALSKAKTLPEPAHILMHNKIKRKKPGQNRIGRWESANDIISRHPIYG